MGKEFVVCEKRNSGVELGERASFMLELMKKTIEDRLRWLASRRKSEFRTDFHFSFRVSYSKPEFRDFHYISTVIGENAKPDQCDDWIKAVTGKPSDAETGFGWIVFVEDRAYHIDTGVVWNDVCTNVEWTESLVHKLVVVLKQNGFRVE